ncbi:DUF4328 domain-containing protein [Corallococcus terminator]
MVAEFAYIAVRRWLFSFVREIGYTQSEAFDIYLESLMALHLIKIVTLLLSAICFLTWQYRAIRIATLLKVSQASPRWAILSWFIPGMNLFKPYQLLRDLWLDLGGEASRTGLIRAWWYTGLLTLALGMWHHSMNYLAEIAGISSGTLRRIQTAHSAIFLLATALCIGIVARIQQQLVQIKAERLRAP